jgi:hypothetical protein
MNSDKKTCTDAGFRLLNGNLLTPGSPRWREFAIRALAIAPLWLLFGTTGIEDQR